MALTPGQPYKKIMVLKEYFGLKPDQSVMQFASEMKALSEGEKNELAELAAKELGVTLAD